MSHVLVRLLPALFLLTALRAGVGDVYLPPEPIEKPEGKYPEIMAAFKIYGVALVDVTVDTTGRPTKPRIVECSHADFESAGIDWALRWRFKPATRNGEPVEATSRLRLTFNIKQNVYDFEHGDPAFRLPPQTPKDGQKEFRYDVAPLLILHSKAVYPRELFIANTKGWAEVTFILDPDGRPWRIESQRASRPEFGAAARAMVAIWRFTPAKWQGQSTWTAVTYRQNFDRVARDSPDNPSAVRLIKVLKSGKDAIVTDLSRLDEPPKPVYRAEIALAHDLAMKILPASAVIEFILDREGNVQLPRVTQASHEDFGWAAATAVQRWKYTVPKVKGVPVDVVMSVSLEMAAPAPGTAKP